MVPSDQTDLAAPFIAPAPVFLCVSVSCPPSRLDGARKEHAHTIQSCLFGFDYI